MQTTDHLSEETALILSIERLSSGRSGMAFYCKGHHNMAHIWINVSRTNNTASPHAGTFTILPEGYLPIVSHIIGEGTAGLTPIQPVSTNERYDVQNL